MDRLTFKGNFCDISRCQGEYRMTSECADGPCSQRKVWERLKDYEDTGLEPDVCAEYKKFEDEVVSKGVTFKRIIELMEAEKDGRLVVLPCNVGDTVYIASSTRGVYEAKVRTFFCGNCGYNGDSSPDVRMIRTTSCDIPMKDFDKTVFLTREEAEAALKGCGGDES